MVIIEGVFSPVKASNRCIGHEAHWVCIMVAHVCIDLNRIPLCNVHI